MTLLLGIAVAAFVVTIAAVAWGKKSARKLQRERRIHIDQFKLKRRHAEIELEVFGSRGDRAGRADVRAASITSTIEQATRAGPDVPAGDRPEVQPPGVLPHRRAGGAGDHALPLSRRRRAEADPRLQRTRGKGAAVVYVINHRSNADYVLVAHMLFKFISLSYAIGEWARVWPLNHVFKWFGGYFVRRRYREPLYHAILAKFVQTITRHGVTQGIFIEGGLTRDGAFQKPKLGMLDYLVTAKRDPEFTRRSTSSRRR